MLAYPKKSAGIIVNASCGLLQQNSCRYLKKKAQIHCNINKKIKNEKIAEKESEKIQI